MNILKSRKSVATIVILATYIFNHINRVCFTIRSSDGSAEYHTCFDNGRGSCTCDGNAVWHKECKHIKHLAPIAVAKLTQAKVKATAEKVIRNRATAEAMLAKNILLGLICETCGGSHATMHHDWNVMSLDEREKAIEQFNADDYQPLNREAYSDEFDVCGLDLL